MVIILESNTQLEEENISIEDQTRYVPGDVIDNILSRLPIKSLIRFQSLSKLHRSRILDPWFQKISCMHQLPKSHNLFLRLTDEVEYIVLAALAGLAGAESGPTGFDLVRLEGENFENVRELGNPFGAVIPLCCCNGIVLLALKGPDEGLVLWNPSIRRYTMIPSSPDMNSWLDDLGSWLYFGFYHDFRADDYKVVIISTECNVVFSCKTTTWAKEEPSPLFSELCGGVLVDGCFYYPQTSESQVVYFDFKERKFGKLKMPDMKASNPTNNEVILLTALRGRLCVYCLNSDGTKLQVWVMQKTNCSWMELNMETKGPHLSLPGRFRINRAYCMANSAFILYNYHIKRFEHTLSISDVMSSDLVPYSKSLFFPF